ncbi:phosphatase PAP2 family protein [Pedobacter nototheniae]|uniref:phosphatase PAP2 family protein n=1 Tax=Pedobacter nototheniae TaxID=2488994 RepID=UPI00103D2D93|nr:phosphatase PAP2 family protein [Pedobacter nototheniae]
MSFFRILFWLLFTFLHPFASFSQKPGDTLLMKKQTLADGKTEHGDFKIRMSPIVGAAASASIVYGFVKLGSHELTDLDIAARQEFALEHPHNKFRIDDYLQFAPGVLALGLSTAGIQGRNKTIDQAGVYLLSNIILTATCQSLKRITQVTRPDGSSNAFPSGHTAEAFASAELLSQEYKERSVIYPISGYAAAVATAYYRMYNNKHWLSDVVAGAGIGFLSTRASYWLYPKIKKIFTRKEIGRSVVMPSYSHGAIGAGMFSYF